MNWEYFWYQRSGVTWSLIYWLRLLAKQNASITINVYCISKCFIVNHFCRYILPHTCSVFTNDLIRWHTSQQCKKLYCQMFQFFVQEMFPCETYLREEKRATLTWLLSIDITGQITMKIDQLLELSGLPLQLMKATVLAESSN